MDKKEKSIKECNICGKNATSLCFKCLQYFCEDCYKYVHNKQINSNHKKEEIDIYVPIDLKCQDHPENSLNLFCLDEKELCCAYCHFKNLHSGHNLLELSNIESIENENINIESSSQEFGKIIEKTISLKNKIEEEINKINILYEQTMKELTNSFAQKHEKLIKIENNLKEQLQIEITKVKENLENFWSRTNTQIKMNERINQGLKKIKEEEKNMIKTLTYISKINKNQKEMKTLLTEIMKSLKFSYQEENNNIKYEEFCFNGIQIPKNIEIKDIKYNSLNISWDIDTINNININYNNIDYIIEMRKDKEKFIEVYKGKNKSCLIDKLSSNIEYEFRICSVYNDIKGFWSDLIKIKTKDFDSNILKESKNGSKFLDKIFDWSGYKNMELLYRGARDGSSSKDFHSKCDNKGPTITLFKNEKGFIFGGFTSISWTDNKGWLTAPDSFIFTLTNIHNIEPNKFNRTNNEYGVYHNIGYGPWSQYRLSFRLFKRKFFFTI